MLATIPDLSGFRLVRFALVLAVATTLASCATKEPPPLIADPSASRETALPWNEQQKWEREGQGAMLNQQRR
jgi:predicted ATPase